MSAPLPVFKHIFKSTTDTFSVLFFNILREHNIVKCFCNRSSLNTGHQKAIEALRHINKYRSLAVQNIVERFC